MTSAKKIIISVLMLIMNYQVIGQISPYSLSPKWYFGNRSGLDFTAGPTPIFLPNGQTNTVTDRIEGAHNICDPSGNVVFYSGGYTLYDANHVLIQNINGGTSSTQSGISIPDPANPTNRFYLFTANVDNNSGGDRPASNTDLGINWYHIQRFGASISVLAGPVKIANNDEVSEQLSSGTDGNGNYWIIAHQGGNWGWGMNSFWVWPVTASGVGSKIISSVTGTTGNNPWQGSIKINKCQTRLAAVFGGGGVEIYNWDQSTGMVTGLIRSTTVAPSAYGCEFSPDGNLLYYTSLNGNKLYQLDIASGTVYTAPSWSSVNNIPEMGTLQLGPDDKIYVINVSDGGLPCYLGVVNQPNVQGAGCNYNPNGFTINTGPSILPNIGRGISNMAWINPNDPIINYSGCSSVSFNYNFNTYFNTNIPVIANSEEWDFGLGSGYQTGLGATPTQTYPIDNTYTVSLKFRDQTCNKVWTKTTTINTTCSLSMLSEPTEKVEWLSIDAQKEKEFINITWSTITTQTGGYYIIEKSIDGINFFQIGTVDMNNITGEATYYQFYDTNPSSGYNYYQIKQVNKDNAYSYSPITKVYMSDNHYHLFSDNDNFHFYTANNEIAQIAVYDVIGKEIIAPTSTSNIIFGETLTTGAYIIKINFANNIEYKRIIKE